MQKLLVTQFFFLIEKRKSNLIRQPVDWLGSLWCNTKSFLWPDLVNYFHCSTQSYVRWFLLWNTNETQMNSCFSFVPEKWSSKFIYCLAKVDIIGMLFIIWRILSFNQKACSRFFFFGYSSPNTSPKTTQGRRLMNGVYDCKRKK